MFQLTKLTQDKGKRKADSKAACDAVISPLLLTGLRRRPGKFSWEKMHLSPLIFGEGDRKGHEGQFYRRSEEPIQLCHSVGMIQFHLAVPPTKAFLLSFAVKDTRHMNEHIYFIFFKDFLFLSARMCVSACLSVGGFVHRNPGT